MNPEENDPLLQQMKEIEEHVERLLEHERQKLKECDDRLRKWEQDE